MSVKQASQVEVVSAVDPRSDQIQQSIVDRTSRLARKLAREAIRVDKDDKQALNKLKAQSIALNALTKYRESMASDLLWVIQNIKSLDQTQLKAVEAILSVDRLKSGGGGSKMDIKELFGSGG